MEDFESEAALPSSPSGWRPEIEDRGTKLRPREITRFIEESEELVEVLRQLIARKLTVTFTSAHASADLEIPHRLGAVPTDILVGLPSTNTVVYQGSNAWTRSNIYLRSTAACSVTIYLVAK